MRTTILQKSSYAQQGVALIQVLLIVSMLLILVVQLSKDSQKQVKSAIGLKEKNQALMQMDSLLEETKFALLTTPRVINPETRISGLWNFYGNPTEIDGLLLALQDESGLISLPYYADYLKYLGGYSESHIASVKSWQGTDESGTILPGAPGKLMQYAKEIHLIPGWEQVALDINLTTHLPTYQFNPLTAPDELLQKLVVSNEAETLITMRASHQVTTSEASEFLDVDLETSDSYPGEIVRLRVEKQFDGWSLVRKYKVRLDVESNKPIKQFGY